MNPSARLAIASCLLAALAACSGEGAAEDGSDLGTLPLGPEVEVGTGRPGTWTPFADGDVVRLQRGCQGAQHIFVSVRVRGASEGAITISLSVRRTSDDERVTAPYDVRLPFAVLTPTGEREETGLMAVVFLASEVIGEEVWIDASIVDSAGSGASMRRRAVIAWGPDDCG